MTFKRLSRKLFPLFALSIFGFLLKILWDTQTKYCNICTLVTLGYASLIGFGISLAINYFQG